MSFRLNQSPEANLPPQERHVLICVSIAGIPHPGGDGKRLIASREGAGTRDGGVATAVIKIILLRNGNSEIAWIGPVERGRDTGCNGTIGGGKWPQPLSEVAPMFLMTTVADVGVTCVQLEREAV
jgi:hypothetical protein